MTRFRTVALGDICSFKYGQMPGPSDRTSDGYPMFSGYRIVGAATRYHHHDPEIIVVARGVGGTGDIKWSPPNCFLTNLAIAVLVGSPDVNKSFLYYRLASTKLWGLRTGSAQAQITIDRLRQYEIDLPALPAQRKIASILSAYDDLIENNNRRIKLLEEMAQRIYREWFVDFRYPGHEDFRLMNSELGPIPEGWVWKELRELAAQSRIGVDPEAVDPATPYIGLEHMPERSIAIADWGAASQVGSRKYEFKAGDVLFGKIRPYFHKVAVPPVDGICSTDAIVIRSRAPGSQVSFSQWFRAMRSSRRPCKRRRGPRCHGRIGMSWSVIPSHSHLHR